MPVMAGERSVRGPAKKSPSKKEKRSVIREYERSLGIDLTEEDLDGLIDEAFSNPDISPDTKKKVKEKLKKKKRPKPKE